MSEIAIVVLVASILSVVREKQILPFAIAALGSLVTGNVAVVAVAGLSLLYRCYYSKHRAGLAKDSLAVLFLILGAALPDPYREFMMTMGAIIFSVNFGTAKLPILPALLIVYDLFGKQIQIEFVIGAFAFFLIVSEALLIFKSAKRELVLKIIEVPVLGFIFIPFYSYVQEWVAVDVLLWSAVGMIIVALVLFIWIKVKSPNMTQIYERVQARILSVLEPLSSFIKEGVPVTIKTEFSIPNEFRLRFNSVFVGVLALVVAWVSIVLILRGGLN